MDERLLEGERRPSSAWHQALTLVWSKELVLKRAQWKTTIGELLLPAALCSIMIIGVAASTLDVVDAKDYAPKNIIAALATAASPGWLFSGSLPIELPVSGEDLSLATPGWVPPLWLYLTYASGVSNLTGGERFPPFKYGGASFAVVPDTAAARDFVEPMMMRVRASQLNFSAAALPVGIVDAVPPAIEPIYLRSEADLESQAFDGDKPIWAALVFHSLPNGSGGDPHWNYTLRLNATKVPSTRRRFDRFPTGLSTKYFNYYASGFLSLQLAVNDRILELTRGSGAGAPSAYGVPFPVDGYKHNLFFNFAGNLIGILVIFSLLVPLSTLLRGIVLERETKLKEQLLIMGTAPAAYYTSLLLVAGGTFLLISLVTAAEIGLSCYAHSDASLVVLLFVLFGAATLAFTLAMAPFFANARLAALVGPLVFFLSSQLYATFLEGGELSDGQPVGKTLASLLPAMAFYLGASTMAQYEGSQQGVHWSNIHDGAFPFSRVLLLLFIDTLLYLALAWYLDAVVPGEFGTARHPLFCFSLSFWRGQPPSAPPARHTESGAVTPLQHGGAVVEPLHEATGGRGVSMHGLRKEYPRGVAVEGLDLQLPCGVITSLLGGNGAGKTTTISMLNGLVRPSAGDATIDGQSILTQMQAIRTSIGVCQQVNTIWPALTPVQHLRLFGKLRGMTGDELGSAVADALARVGLESRADVPAGSLSGGQKRKLCLAIAVLGGSRTLFLDEPTSGMDPHSRRAIWALLRQMRVGRTVVLTTHFLDEAEILSDRIAILSNGRLRCVGSPLFLKSHYGVGHTLTLTKSRPGARFDSSELLRLVRGHVPAAELAGQSVDALVLRLPGQDLSALQRAFAAIEQARDGLGVRDLGVACTTLEDVFLQINEKDIQRLKEIVSASDMARRDESPSSADGGSPTAPLVPDASSETSAVASGAGGAQAVAPTPSRVVAGANIFRGLVVKRAITARRDVLTTCCSFCCPIWLVLFALLLLGLSTRLSDPGPALAFTPDVAFAASIGSHGFVTAEGVPILVPDKDAPLFADRLGAHGWAVEGGVPACSAGLAAGRNVSAYLRANPSCTRPAALAIAALQHPLLSPGIIARLPGFLKPFAAELLGSAALDSLLFAFFNSTSTHAMPTILNSAYDALLANATGGTARLSASAQALPYSKRQEATLSSIIAVFASIMILVPFAFVGALFVTPLLRERESGSKQMQFVSGVSGPAYWSASWAWDGLLFFGVLICTLGVFGIVDQAVPAAAQAFVGTAEAACATALALALFGFAAITLASAASFFFTSPSAGLIALIAFHFVTGFGLVIANFVLSFIENTEHVNEQLQPVYRLFPAFCLGDSFYKMASRQALASALGGADAMKSLYDLDQLGAPLVSLICEGVFFGAVTLLLQYNEATSVTQMLLHRCRRFLGQSAATPEPNAQPVNARGIPAVRQSLPGGSLEDESVRAERAAVDAGDTHEKLILTHLHKVYGIKVAVRDVSLRIREGECFGFLGTNGAGKSTTFNMLTGAVVPTSGDATLDGMSIRRQQASIRSRVGYCPQHDALESLMTGRETLRLYARVKAVPNAIIEADVEDLLQLLDLAKYADKPAGTYSGGNKRKLCVGIALIGRPSLVLLDEPSSGMDAASKRFLWAAIKQRTARSCTVLTTHSMEECEALCGRIGIMVDGSLRCVGPIQTLKSKYGQGYKLDVRLDPARPTSPEDVLALLQQRFAGARIDEFEPPNLSLTVPQAGLALSSLFGHLVELRATLPVQEASVTQCTLEQIFLLMAAKAALRSSMSIDGAAAPQQPEPTQA